MRSEFRRARVKTPGILKCDNRAFLTIHNSEEEEDFVTTMLAETTRGGVVESVHQGVVAVANTDGKIIASAGDPSTFAFYRFRRNRFRRFRWLKAERPTVLVSPRRAGALLRLTPSRIAAPATGAGDARQAGT